jgi:hypothetical protein
VRLRAGILVVPFVLAVVTACGSGDGPPTITVKTLRQGAEQMAAGSARMRGTSVRGEGSDVERFHLAGAYDGATHAARFTAEPDGPPAENVGSSETLVVDGTRYYRLWDSTEQPGRWLRYGPDSEVAQLQAMWLDVTNPFSLLDQLRDVASLDVIGIETIDDVETTHLDVRIDFEALIARLPASLRDAARPEARSAGDESFDVWVDGDGAVRRLSGGNSRRPMNTTIDFYDFGAPVNIEAPSADQVVDANDPVAMADYYTSMGLAG